MEFEFDFFLVRLSLVVVVGEGRDGWEADQGV